MNAVPPYSAFRIFPSGSKRGLLEATDRKKERRFWCAKGGTTKSCFFFFNVFFLLVDTSNPNPLLAGRNWAPTAVGVEKNGWLCKNGKRHRKKSHAYIKSVKKAINSQIH